MQEDYSHTKNLKRIYVIQDDDIDIYYYFKKCEFVIGTNSTALVEAIPFSEVLVYKKGWYFELEDYISKKLMRDFESKQDFLSFFNSNISEKKKNNMPELKPDFSEKIFCKNSEEQINFEISKIIETHISNG